MNSVSSTSLRPTLCASSWSTSSLSVYPPSSTREKRPPRPTAWRAKSGAGGTRTLKSVRTPVFETGFAVSPLYEVARIIVNIWCGY